MTDIKQLSKEELMKYIDKMQRENSQPRKLRKNRDIIIDAYEELLNHKITFIERQSIRKYITFLKKVKL